MIFAFFFLWLCVIAVPGDGLVFNRYVAKSFFHTPKSFQPTSSSSSSLSLASVANSNTETVSSSVLNKLLTQAANMVMSNYNKSSSTATTTGATTSSAGEKTEETNTVNVAFSFASHLTKKIHFNNSVKAQWYLSLPVTEYSVLDQSLVEKSVDRDDLFHLNIPLDQIAIALDGISPNIGYRTLAKYLLKTDIQVDSNAAKGVIHMTSGPFAFVLNPNASIPEYVDMKAFSSRRHFPTPMAFIVSSSSLSDNITPAVNASDERPRENITVTSPISTVLHSDKFPTWLSWGDQETLAFMNISSNANTSIVSSLQPGVSIHWTWPKSTTSRGQHSMFSSFSLTKLKNFFRSDHGNSHSHSHSKGTSHESSEKDELVTKLKVSVRMDMNIPMPAKLGRAISLLPVKMLLQQAGSMIISAFLKNLVPYFQTMLLKDYENRSFSGLPLSSSSNNTVTMNS